MGSIARIFFFVLVVGFNCQAQACQDDELREVSRALKAADERRSLETGISLFKVFSIVGATILGGFFLKRLFAKKHESEQLKKPSKKTKEELLPEVLGEIFIKTRDGVFKVGNRTDLVTSFLPKNLKEKVFWSSECTGDWKPLVNQEDVQRAVATTECRQR